MTRNNVAMHAVALHTGEVVGSIPTDHTGNRLRESEFSDEREKAMQLRLWIDAVEIEPKPRRPIRETSRSRRPFTRRSRRR
jgi:hypothetical protein